MPKAPPKVDPAKEAAKAAAKVEKAQFSSFNQLTL